MLQNTSQKALLLVNRFWDLVSGKRTRPNPAPAAIGAFGIDSNQLAIDAANKKLDDFDDTYNKAACLLVESISDSEIISVTSVLEDPVAVWNKLQQKFARRSEMGQEAAQMALLQFQHVETETANETIERFEAITEKCAQQGVAVDDHLLERMLLSQPNDRYTYLKKSYQHSKVKQDLQELFSSMRDDDADYQRNHAPPALGSAAFADAIKEAIKENAELLWAQRGKDSGRQSGSRSANSSTVCYCCGEKGHYAKDCRHSKSQCKFCKRTGHLEAACRQKKSRDEGGPSGEASFFHGGSSAAVAQLENCDSNHGQYSQFSFGESFLGEIEFIPSTTFSTSQLLAPVPDSRFEAMVASVINTHSTYFLGDTGASHHIVHKREYFHDMTPLPGIFKIHQVQGTVSVTHWGTVIVEVDSASGKKPLRLT